MKAWEYLVITFSQDFNNYRPTFYNNTELPNWKKNPPMTEYLNGLGKDGWELVSSLPIGPNTGQIKLFLKREK
jgi:hypothetical protein